MDFALVAAGAALAILGGWIADRRRVAHETNTRWLTVRRELYASVVEAARQVEDVLAAVVRDPSSRSEGVTKARAALSAFEMIHAQMMMVASPGPLDASEHIRDWAEDAEITMRRETQYRADDIKMHLQRFSTPFVRFFDACRRDLGLPLIETSFHAQSQRFDRREKGGNPYGGAYRPTGLQDVVE